MEYSPADAIVGVLKRNMFRRFGPQAPSLGTAAVRAMGVLTPRFSTWKQRAGNFDLAYAFGGAGACRPVLDADGTARANVSCFDEARRSAGLMPRVCSARPAPPLGSRLLEYSRADLGSARPVPALAGLDWHQQLEEEGARAFGLPLLRSFRARLERWDAHPGIQGGRLHPPAIYDCGHSSFAPGAYDGEMTALLRLLRPTAPVGASRRPAGARGA